MARTVLVFAPAGATTPTLRLVNEVDVIVQTVTLAEDPNTPGRYRGTLTAPAPPTGQLYTGVFFDGASALATYGYCRPKGVDPETVYVGDNVGSVDGFKLNTQVRRTVVAADGTGLVESVGEEPPAA